METSTKGQMNLERLCGCQGAEIKKITLSGGDNEGVPPVPIPNTEVKPFSADGTWLETARESRSLPDSITAHCKRSELYFISRQFRNLNLRGSAQRRPLVSVEPAAGRNSATGGCRRRARSHNLRGSVQRRPIV